MRRLTLLLLPHAHAMRPVPWLAASAATLGQLPGCVLLQRHVAPAAAAQAPPPAAAAAHRSVHSSAALPAAPQGGRCLALSERAAWAGRGRAPRQQHLSADAGGPQPAAPQLDRRGEQPQQAPAPCLQLAPHSPGSAAAAAAGPPPLRAPAPSSAQQLPRARADTTSASSGGAAAVAAAVSWSDGGSGGSMGSLPSWQTTRSFELTPEQKLKLLQVKLGDAWGTEPPPLEQLSPGTHRMVCPECGNGSHAEDCFALTVTEDDILWCCHRANCGFQGAVHAHSGRDARTSWASSAAAQAAALAASSRAGSSVPALPTLASAPQPGPGSTWQQAPPPPPLQQLQQEQQQQQQRAPGSLTAGLQPLSDEQLEWFRARGIEREVLEANGVMGARRYCGALGQSVDHIAFPYAKDGAVVNVKYRALPKHFSQSKGGEQVFYGYDGARGAQELIIVEGELDKLSVEQALLKQEQAAAAAAAEAGGPPQPRPRRAVLSVPAGAPSRGAGPATSLERKFRYVDACSDILSAAERVILAVDSDGPGVVLAGELARRIGRERCCLVTWPTARENSLAPPDAPRGQAGDWARKDANEVLLKDGEQVLAAYIDAAKPLPIRGLFRFDEFWEQVYDLYQQGPKGLSWGVSTGWESVDACYKVVPGELTLVTGLPNSGKSEWLDALAVNLAQLHGWRIGLCSLENSPREHGRKLMEKYTGKAFFDAPYAAGTAKMGFEELVDALVWLDGHFHIIRPPKDSVPTIEYILERARAAVLRYGITGLIIDPYNELDHRRPAALSETEHVSMLLTKVKRFAQHYDVHVWFVAHPRTQRGLGTGGGTASLSAPTMYDISGSAHFINKADNGIVVHRPGTASGRADPCGVQLLVRKVRNKLAGRVGDVALTYSRATGRYVDDRVEGRAD